MLQFGVNAYASDFVIDEEKVWFVPFGYNCLCCYNLKQKEMEKRIGLPVENNKSVLYGGVMKSGRKIILIPYEADSTIVYDINDGKIERFLADEARCEEIYRAYCAEKDNIWMVPWIRKTNEVQDVYIKKINLNDGKVEFLEVFPKNTMPKDRGERWLLNGNCVHIENSVYIGYRNYMIEIDLCNNCRDSYVIGDDKTIYTTMCMVDNERLCMMDIYGNVTIWNRKNRQTVMEIENKKVYLKNLGFPNGHGHREGYGSSAVYRDEYVWFIPSHADKVLQLDLKKNMLSEAWFSNEICGNIVENPDCCGQFSKVHIWRDYLYIWNLWNESFFIIEIKSHKIERRYIEVGLNPNEFCSMLWKCMEENKGICYEERLGTDGLNLLIHSICSNEYDRHERKNGLKMRSKNLDGIKIRG